ncbi:MAG: hypothetical protein CMJ78_08515 [Planctomycetaceae bacterium]|nr:hypothetical protein [Planctomycetaceae bacterium]
MLVKNWLRLLSQKLGAGARKRRSFSRRPQAIHTQPVEVLEQRILLSSTSLVATYTDASSGGYETNSTPIDPTTSGTTSSDPLDDTPIPDDDDDPSTIDPGFAVDDHDILPTTPCGMSGSSSDPPEFSTSEEEGFTTGNVLDNDSGSGLSIVGFDTSMTDGLVSDNGDGTFQYDPNGAFNHLESGSYDTDTFEYTASDGTDNSTATVTVIIWGSLSHDEQIGPPQITQTTPLSVDEDQDGSEISTAGAMVGPVAATDPDDDALSFAILDQEVQIDGSWEQPWNGAINHPFIIGAETGVISVSSEETRWRLNYEQNDTYRVKVQVTDGFAYDTEWVTITVNDVNEAPTSNGTATVQVWHTAAAGTVIYDFDSSDADASATFGTNSHQWSLDSGAEYFSLDPTTGELSLTGTLPSTEQFVSASVTDGGGLSVSTNITVKSVDEITVSAKGSAWHGSNLTFHILAPRPIGMPANPSISTIEVDIDNDGSYDASGAYDALFGGLFLENVNQLNLLGTPATTGSYPAKAKLNWSDSTSSIHEFTIEVSNAEPTVTLSAPSTGSTGSPIAISVTASDVLPGQITNIVIDFDDGTTQTVTATNGVVTAADGNLSHVYTDSGSYIITAIATDDEGGTFEESREVRIDNAGSPIITSSTFTLLDGYPDDPCSTTTIYGQLDITAVTASGTPIPGTGDSIIWDTDYSNSFSAGGAADANGTSVILYADNSGVFNVNVEITDPVSGTRTVGFYEFVADGMPVGGVANPAPKISGEGSAPGDLLALTQSNVEKAFELLYPDKNSKDLLRAYKRAGGVIDFVDPFVTLGWKWDFDYWVGGGGAMRIQLDDDLTAPMAAYHLMEGLIEAAGTTEVRRWLVTYIGDSGDVTNLITSYQSGLRQAAQQATTLAELYVDGLGMISSGADFIISIAAATSAAEDGNTAGVVLAALPFIPVIPKGIGKLKIIHNGVEHLVSKEMLEAAIKYANLVNTDKWDSWADQIPGFNDTQRKKIRKLARALDLVPTIPISTTVPGYIGKRVANFDSVAHAIPGQAPPYLVDLPMDMWLMKDKKQFAYLWETYLPGTTLDQSSFTWHHHHLTGKMQLVPKGIHRVNHYGGRSAGAWCHFPRDGSAYVP